MSVRIDGEELLDGRLLHGVDEPHGERRPLSADLPYEDSRLSARVHEERRRRENIKCDEEHRRGESDQIGSHFSLKYFSAPAFIGRDIPSSAVAFVICLPTACAACRRSRFEKIAFVML